MRLKFSKMQALGNDFVVIDGVSAPLALSASQCRTLADRRHGVGCDQILLLEPPPDAEVDFGYRIFNADGGSVGQCGNGARAIARFVQRQRLSDAAVVRYATPTTRFATELHDDGEVSVELAAPQFDPADIPIARAQRAERYRVEVDGETVSGGAVSMGNPHFVIAVDDVEAAPVQRLGAALSGHVDFPEGANIGFLAVADARRLQLRVFERGVGETPACGSGACAAAAIARVWGLTEETVEVQLPGGSLQVRWPGDAAPLWLRGGAEFVFDGEIDL